MTFIDLPEDIREKPAKENPDQNNKPKTNRENSSYWDADLYPERKHHKVTKPLTDYIALKAGREELRKINCERSVYKCFKESRIIRLFVGAMKASGCPVDIRRHISCEECAPEVAGGYDPVLNQVVLCHNNTSKDSRVQMVLMHEMVHMFDFCRNNMDYRNLDHLACTEIRAANLAHCSFMSAWMNGDTSLFNFKGTHQNCVKSKALLSMMTVRNITKLQAVDAIERVFDKCYNDLEPVGRRLRRNSLDMYKAFEEGFYYGYDDGL
ncbi:mitochondrial inner membrane protease ATP23 homolog [Anthonomus grandis grandis]|uniref:mitochondrial inner membrane protease ATP23 homolog n=1 Tax=Anthonomus grandis grandis TaxID=2921223 RepID=UPI002165F12C|nr:mitochondrial inner membrane protease ATP23 homolog [Anthonomus grandis grandis]